MTVERVVEPVERRIEIVEMTTGWESS